MSSLSQRIVSLHFSSCFIEARHQTKAATFAPRDLHVRQSLQTFRADLPHTVALQAWSLANRSRTSSASLLISRRGARTSLGIRGAAIVSRTSSNDSKAMPWKLSELLTTCQITRPARADDGISSLLITAQVSLESSRPWLGPVRLSHPAAIRESFSPLARGSRLIL